jgi:methyl-accepting chemotaxis protein
MGGFAGELGELIPELKELTAEELKAGKGIDLLAEKFKNTAAQTTSFAKTVAQLSNAWGDVLEGIGDAITKNAELSRSIQDVTKWLVENKDEIADISKKLLEFTKTVLGGLIKAFKAVVDAGTKVLEFFEDWNGQVEAATASTGALEATAHRLGISVEELERRMAAGAVRTSQLNAEFSETKKTADETTPKVDRLGDAFDTLKKKDPRTAIDALNDVIERAGEVFGDTEEEVSDLGASLDTVGDAGGKVAEGFVKVKQVIEEVGRAAITTTAQFDRLAESAGRAVATAAAIEGGGELVLGGTRVNLPGGGSRLTRAPGTSGLSSGGGGPFVQAGFKTARLAADGRIIFV